MTSTPQPPPPPTPVFIQQTSKQVTFVRFSSSSSASSRPILYSGNRDGDLVVYDCTHRRAVFTANANQQAILTIVELDSDLNHVSLLTHTRNGRLFKWTGPDVSTLQFKCVYERDAYTFCPISLEPDARKLLFVASSEPAVIDCIETSRFERVNRLQAASSSSSRGMLMSLKSIGGDRVMAGYENGELAVYDLRMFAQQTAEMLYKGQPLMCFDYSVGKNVGVCGSSDEWLRQFSIDDKGRIYHEEKSGSTIQLANPGQNCVTIRPADSRLFATGGWDSRVRLYSLKKLKPLVALDFHKEAVNSIDFSTDNLMACGSNDCIISFWKIYND